MTGREVKTTTSISRDDVVWNGEADKDDSRIRPIIEIYEPKDKTNTEMFMEVIKVILKSGSEDAPPTKI